MSAATAAATARGWQPWLLAARPATLPAAVVPVLVGTAAAVDLPHVRLGPFLGALLASLLIQVGTNFANDVFDFHRGADTPERLGPVRITQSGLVPPRQVLAATYATFGLATLVGIYLVAVGGWPILAIGVASILAGLAYTGGPWPFGYHGLGDLSVFVFFGLVAVAGSAYLQTLSLTPLVGWAAVPIGLLVTAILVVNNLRDIDTDRAAGKRTLAVRLGRWATRVQYALFVFGAYLVPPALWLAGALRGWALLPWLTLPLAVALVRLVWTAEGRPLNRALSGTGRLHLLFGLLFALALWL